MFVIQRTWREVAARQHGCLTSAQLVAGGLSTSAVARKVADGELLRVRRGLYVVGGSEGSSWQQRLWLQVLASGQEAVVSHRSAASLWELDGSGSPSDGAAPVEVSVLSFHRSGPGIHRHDGFGPGEVTVLEGLRVTTPARTLLDLGSVVGVDDLERAVECALRRDLVTAAQLDELLSSNRRRGRRGPAALARVLGRRPAGAPATESDAETLFLQLARRVGLPEPERQFALRVGGRLIRLDFAWPAVRLAVEIDGAATHATPEALLRDLRRQNRIVLGWLLLRFTWSQVALQPHYVTGVLRRSFALTAAGPLPSEEEL